MKRVLSCLLAVLLVMCGTLTAYAEADGAVQVVSGELAERLYGGDTDEITDPGLAAFLNGYEGNDKTSSMRGSSLYVEHYDVEMTITSDRTVSVVETLDVMFNDEGHGYFRYIPTYGSEEMYRISNLKARGAEVLITEESDQVSVRLGSEDITVRGLMTYVISYDIEYFNDITSNGDRIYQNVFPGELEDYVRNATARITIPEDTELVDYRIYTGSYGSVTSDMEVYVHDGVMYMYADRHFSPRTGATVELLFPEGTFKTRPADITVKNTQFELNVESDGTYTLNQYLVVEVSDNTSHPILPVWQTIGLKDMMSYDDNYIGVGSVRIAIAVDGSTVKTERGVTDVCLINLSKYKGQSVTVTSVQKGQYAVEDGLFSLSSVIMPVSYHSGCMVEYENISFTAHLPTAEGESFYSSQSAYTDSESSEYHFVITETEDGFVAEMRGQLPVGETATIEVHLPEDAVTRRMTWLDWTTILLSLGLLIAVTILRCQKKRHMVSTMEYYPPDDLNPAEVGYIIDGKADAKDLTSLIYYWASKGYLTIEITGKTTYTLHKLADLGDDHQSYERMMFRKLWSLGGNDGNVTSVQLTENFYYTLAKAMAQLKNRYSRQDRRLSDAARDKAVNILSLVALGSAVLLPALAMFAAPVAQGTEIVSTFIALLFYLPAFLLLRWKGGTVFEKRKGIVRLLVNLAAIALCVLGSLLYVVFAGAISFGIFVSILLSIAAPVALCLAPGARDRSEYGAYIIGRCLGFKNFLKTAEAERLEMLLEETPEYYYNILPYAQVLGVSDIWEDKLKNLNAQPPEWFYGTDVTPSTARYLMMRNMVNMNSNLRTVPVETSSSSGGGRFGGFSGGGGSFGGGFSGGGGGGGGGGGWQ